MAVHNVSNYKQNNIIQLFNGLYAEMCLYETCMTVATAV